MHLLSLFSYINTSNIKNAFFHLRTFGFRSVIRKTLDYLEFTRNYNFWRRAHITSPQVLEEQRNVIFALQPKISIIVPVYKTPEKFLRQMLDSVMSQTYSHWELCIADGSADPASDYILNIITEYQLAHKNIRYTKLPENLGISGNTNAALALATGDYIALLDHDDILAPDALFEIVREINQHPDTDILYTDEDKVDISLKSYYGPYFKPDFNLDLLRSCNYITHFYVVKKQLAELVNGFSDHCNGSQDYDFILKTSEKAKCICHIPKILYHWRIHPASVAGDPESKTYAYDSAVRALQEHLDRCGETGTVKKASQFGYYQITYHYSDNPKISIYLKNCNPKLRLQLQRISTYSNYEFVASPSDATGEYLVILYHIKNILTPNWMEQFLGNCYRSNIGIVSAKIHYKKNRVLEAGLTYTPDGQIHSPFYKLYHSDTGYCYRAKVQQNCSLVNPHCIMVPTILFQKYFKRNHSNTFLADIWTFCRTLTGKNYMITLLPNVIALCSNKQYISRTVYEPLKNCQDPFYNPNFSEEKMYHLKK